MQFTAELVHAQPISDGAVDIQCFFGDTTALFGVERADRAHIVEPISQFDDDHPNIPGHCQRHFLKVFGLCLGSCFEADVRELTDTVNQFSDSFTKLGLQRIFGDPGVFDDIMQHRRHQTLVIHPHIRENFSDLKGMDDVGIA